MWNIAFSGTAKISEAALHEQLLKELYNVLRTRLPIPWGLKITPEVRRGNRRADATLAITAPDGTITTTVVEVKRQIEPRDVSRVSAQLRSYAEPGESLLAVTPFLAPRTKQLLAEENINYADLTGNLRFRLDNPAVYIESSGNTSNPWKEMRPLHSLKGPTAGRVVRALCDFCPPYGIRALAERSNTPVASVSRVVTLLEREALLDREPRGSILNVRWAQLLQQWTASYTFTKSNTITTCLEPRGIDVLSRKLQNSKWQYAVTGSLAAMRIAPFSPPRLAALYVSDFEAAITNLDLRITERGANVLLALPFDSVVFDRTVMQDGINYAALSQVAADLLTGPGRGPEEAEKLLIWMEEHEDAWRAD